MLQRQIPKAKKMIFEIETKKINFKVQVQFQDVEIKVNFTSYNAC